MFTRLLSRTLPRSGARAGTHTNVTTNRTSCTHSPLTAGGKIPRRAIATAALVATLSSGILPGTPGAFALEVHDNGDTCTILPSRDDESEVRRLKDATHQAAENAASTISAEKSPAEAVAGVAIGLPDSFFASLVASLELSTDIVWPLTISKTEAESMYETNRPSPYFPQGNPFLKRYDAFSDQRTKDIAREAARNVAPAVERMEERVGDKAFHRALGTCIGVSPLAQLSSDDSALASSEDLGGALSSEEGGQHNETTVAVEITLGVASALALLGGFIANLDPAWIPTPLRTQLAVVFPQFSLRQEAHQVQPPAAPVPAPAPAVKAAPAPAPAPARNWQPRNSASRPANKHSAAPAQHKRASKPRLNIDIRTIGPFPG